MYLNMVLKYFLFFIFIIVPLMLTWSFTNIMSTCPTCLKFVPLMRTYHLLIPRCSFGTPFVSNDFGYYGHNCTLWCLATFQAMIEHPLQIFCVSNIGTKPITTHAIIRTIFFNLHIYIYTPYNGSQCYK